MSELWLPGLEKYLSYNSLTFKQHCKKIIKDRYILWWNASVYSNGKLRCYLWMRSIIPTAHNSDISLLRQPITPTTHFSDNAK
jgi:hypothetical protein